MNIGNTLLLVSFFALSASMLLRKHENYFSWMLRWAFFSISLSVLLLVYYFLSSELLINYVYVYGGEISPLYKIAAMWAGKEGMFLLLAWATMLCILIFHLKNKGDNGFAQRTLFITLVIEILLLIITLFDSPFEPTLEVFNADMSSGHGLSPKFISPWFIVHPPLLIMAYASSIIMFAASATYLYSGEKEWVGTARSWGRSSWLMLSLGMATGGLWAYETLEWNGYWKWDSIQSGTLAVWLILTAALHAIVRHRRNENEYKTTAPLLAASVFILNIFVMFFARKGVRGSEHNFLGSDVWSILLVVLFLAMIAILFLILKRSRSGYEGCIQKQRRESLSSLRSSFHATILLLCLLAFIPFWGILHSLISEKIFGEIVLIPEELYNFWSFPIILLLILLTGYCMLQVVVKPKNLLLFMLAAVMIAAVTSFLPGTPTLLNPASEFYQRSSFLVQFIGSMPVIPYVFITLLMAGGIIFRFIRIKNRFSRSNISIALIHAGFVFIIIGAIVSASFTRVDSFDYDLKKLNVLRNIDSTWSVLIADNNIVNNGNESQQTSDLNFYKNGYLHGSGTVSLTKSDQSGYFHKILIHRTLFTDIVVHFSEDALSRSSIRLSAKVIPMVNVLWGGIFLMTWGFIILIKLRIFSNSCRI
ncbi:MAG: cytochrome c biogenesis protein CcsA [Candidatus Methanoperedens sp.]|nr:cytochrome c biogenesis protein CcsA [Candidatus Methanoperedens sp.]